MKLGTKKIAALIANNWALRSRVQTFVLMLATVVGMYLCYMLAAPFLAALTWALALAELSVFAGCEVSK